MAPALGNHRALPLKSNIGKLNNACVPNLPSTGVIVTPVLGIPQHLL